MPSCGGRGESRRRRWDWLLCAYLSPSVSVEQLVCPWYLPNNERTVIHCRLFKKKKKNCLKRQKWLKMYTLLLRLTASLQSILTTMSWSEVDRRRRPNPSCLFVSLPEFSVQCWYVKMTLRWLSVDRMFPQRGLGVTLITLTLWRG